VIARYLDPCDWFSFIADLPIVFDAEFLAAVFHRDVSDVDTRERT
jgi:hypothetical protein